MCTVHENRVGLDWATQFTLFAISPPNLNQVRESSDSEYTPDSPTYRQGTIECDVINKDGCL
ncbi:hypothetical protein DPMN_040403 [Dreissena polymorpha]|uniref:Uncharacterized protein n=1 Tax=Dreissena polymorpha TaxID=45954 RepID=A0A9D4CWM8_DREPO|nr:hypothetical protein DPMN_040403 [Dreissena polymorpha]